MERHWSRSVTLRDFPRKSAYFCRNVTIDQTDNPVDRATKRRHEWRLPSSTSIIDIRQKQQKWSRGGSIPHRCRDQSEGARHLARAFRGARIGIPFIGRSAPKQSVTNVVVKHAFQQKSLDRNRAPRPDNRNFEEIRERATRVAP